MMNYFKKFTLFYDKYEYRVDISICAFIFIIAFYLLGFNITKIVLISSSIVFSILFLWSSSNIFICKRIIYYINIYLKSIKEFDDNYAIIKTEKQRLTSEKLKNIIYFSISSTLFISFYLYTYFFNYYYFIKLIPLFFVLVISAIVVTIIRKYEINRFLIFYNIKYKE
jgi:hypothetical protein